MEKRHKYLDHAVLGYFLLILFAMIITNIFSGVIDIMILGKIIPGYLIEQSAMGIKFPMASGVGMALGSIAAIGIFYLWFRPSFKGILIKKGLLTGLILLLPILVIHWMGSFVSWVQYSTASVLLAFLRAFAPGFGEETTFRALGVANYLRSVPTEKGVMQVFWLSSVVFGLVHLGNAFAGAPLVVSIGQAAYAIGIGMVLGAVFLRTGNIWPSIIGHMSLDFLELIRDDFGTAGGVITNTGIGDWITIAAGALGLFWGLYLVRSSKRQEIVELWKEKWSGK